ncbi:hypothetical protein C8R47DRAFT_933168, partial [Mycena vitilis]
YDNCSLHLHYVLPRIVFVDPYELTNRADVYPFKYDGPSNIERSVFALSAAEDDVDAELPPTVAHSLPADGALEVEVPLHVRYG